MADMRAIKVEALTEASFAPFGQLISAKDRTPDFQTESGTQGWAVDFAAGAPLIMLLRTPYRGLQFTKLERHFHVTQSFLPLGGSPAVLAVAPPGARREPPRPEDVRAFLLDGSTGYALARGTWHSLDRFALYPPATQWVIVTDHETQDDLTAAYAGRGTMTLTEEFDFGARLGLTFSLAL
jgi:ureidoglycolate lyase